MPLPALAWGRLPTLVVVMIRSFAELLNLPLDDYTIAQMAYKIERVDCGLQGGRRGSVFSNLRRFQFHGVLLTMGVR